MGSFRLAPLLIAVSVSALGVLLLSVSARSLSFGPAYTIWTGTGIVAAWTNDIAIFQSPLDSPTGLGVLLTVAGIDGLAFFSTGAAH